MIVYKTPSGGCGFGPDFVRTSYKYEVTNGVSSIDETTV